MTSKILASRVLLVDDDPDDNFLLMRALYECGVENVEALCSAEDAAKYISGLPPYELREMPNLIFLDMKMRGVDGMELIRWVKRDPIFKEIPIIVLTGSVQKDDKAKAMDMGAKGFYQKPQNHDDLIQLCKIILKESLVANF